MILLSGEKSSIASYLLPILRDEFQVCSFDSEKGDITDKNFVQQIFREIAPTVFINIEELSDYAKAEVFREWAYNLNAFAPGHMASICKEHNIFYLHLSTTQFYTAHSKSAFTEESPLAPLSVYADSKLLGEQKVIESGAKCCIVRVPQVFGRGDSFISPYLAQMFEKKPINLIKNQKIMPVYAQDLAKVILHIVKHRVEGVYNYAGAESFTSYEFLFRVFDAYNRIYKTHYDPQVEEVDYERYLSPVDEPKYNEIDSSKLLSIFPHVQTGVDDALTESLGGQI